MAHSRSARKRVRTAARRTEINRARRSRVRTFIKKVEAAVAAGDQSAARAALTAAQPGDPTPRASGASERAP